MTGRDAGRGNRESGVEGPGAERLTPGVRPSVERRAPNADSFPGRVLAIDYGVKRIGLAVSDPSRTVATPAGVIARRAGKRPPVAELLRRAASLEVREFVLGLPLDENGDATPLASEVRRVAAALHERTGLRVTLVDERYTTAAALRAVREMGGSTRGRKGDIDSLAAAILLQNVLHWKR
jgi:putative Holliday junction resolvase